MTSTENSIQEEKPEYTLLSTEQLVERNKYLTLGGVRWMAFKAKHDFKLRETFLRVGRRLYWKEEKVLEYLEAMNQKSMEEEGVYEKKPCSESS